MLQSATEHYAAQAQLAAAAVVATRAKELPRERIAALIALFQLLAAREAIASVPKMLAEQGISSVLVASPQALALAGWLSNGLAVTDVLPSVERGYPLERFVATQVQDAGRNAASVSMTSAPQATGYVRMLNPPSCSRCAVLAGRFYRWNTGFQRHPLCDCRHIPTHEDAAGDLTTDPSAYFNSLSPEQQARIFTKAGAEAIRDGADISRVVNARRGMDLGQIHGNRAWVTTEATKRGQIRLMPESIYRYAKDRDDAIRLLKLHGYVL